MTIKEAILASLEHFNEPANAREVYEKIVALKLYHFEKGKTPYNTVQALLGTFIREGDERIKRTKVDKEFKYYLAKKEESIQFEEIHTLVDLYKNKNKPKSNQQTYHERDLHILLSTFLREKGIYAKTIFHEASSSKTGDQVWIHPDMIGIEFQNPPTDSTFELLKATNPGKSLRISSYELKKEIKSDNELKQSYFQAVSNSSWANFGYLVALNYNDNLLKEMERLNKSFGIGFIELNANPYSSKVKFQAAYRDLDYTTIDKLCVNPGFSQFIELIAKYISAPKAYIEPSRDSLENLCDPILANDQEIDAYCKKHHIPQD